MTGSPTLLALGNFDGVHRGHASLLLQVAREARARDLAPCVMTFHPRPAEVLNKAAELPLTHIDRKVELLHAIDPEARVIVERFDWELARMSPEEFTRVVLVERHLARCIVVGENFRFGRGREGHLGTLQRLGHELGFEARTTTLLDAGGVTISSSLIREQIRRGEVEAACSLLGRPHSVAGVVEPGDGRGRILGFPTANLGSLTELLPANGVYACRVDLRDLDLLGLPAVCNVGVRPTVLGRDLRLEAHLFDWDTDVVGQRARVHFAARLREERKFASLDELRTQIELDAAQARALQGQIP